MVKAKLKMKSHSSSLILCPCPICSPPARIYLRSGAGLGKRMRKRDRREGRAPGEKVQ
jgi:hypothetical protein